MTKRRVENELDELSDEILRELSPDERLPLVLTAAADGKDDWLDRLNETCPRYTYTKRDVRYTNRTRLAFILARKAVYDLHTTWLLFEWLYSHHMQMTVIALCTELDPENVDRLDDSEGRDPGALLRHLYATYHGYERFADEDLGVSLETWLSIHPEGEGIATAVAEVLEERAGLLSVAEEDVTPQSETDDSEERVPVDELADLWYRNVNRRWTDAVSG
ncbi:hypothetical protein [Halorussus marinus]|uniref:hypothetical protein n=1 Tax=Halorussus marinus TaxID=2505976 RepID=UPI00106E65B7|nr:hypothetical protein [Halorussus marinus]